MHVERMYTGSWFPRTQLHLKEYYQFLTEGTSLLPIDSALLKATRKHLSPKEVHYVGLASEGRFDHVNADIGGLHTVYFEDGLLVAHMEVTRIADDLKRLHRVYDEKMLPALGVLFSIGLPAITSNDPSFADRSTVVITQAATPKAVETFLTAHNDQAHFVATHEEHRVHFADKFIVIVTKDLDSPLTKRLARSLIFFREFEKRLGHFLNLHRTVWQTVEDIRGKKTLALKELPAYRDLLLDFDRDLSVVVARLGQMEYFLDERKIEIDEFGFTAYFRALEAYRFGKMHTNIKYLSELWDQLHEYLQSSAEIIGLMYQDNLQKSVDVLQFIFLVGAVASVIILGNMSGNRLFFNDVAGKPIATGLMEGFDLQTLLLFGGISILLSIIFFLGTRLFTNSFKRVKTSSILGERKPFVPPETR